MYRRNFVEQALKAPSESILPSNLYLFFLLDKNDNAVFMELHKNQFEIEPLKVSVKQKGLGYMVMKGDVVVDLHTATKVRKAERLAMANPNRAPLDMSYGADGRMAKSQLRSIARIAEQLQNVLQDQDRLPQWVHTKIATSLDRLTTSYNYLMSKIQSMEMKSNPSYVMNGEQMCVMAWLSSVLMSHPMPFDEIIQVGQGVWDQNLLQIALQDLLKSGEIVELANDKYFDRDFAEDQGLI